ncbi:MAG: alpha-L-rhamnosidase N-terminal domain-containing protein [Candidatus Hydrogenedentes bacterium]|nr:alpha-L-rhamnosidase N-terminal domain-containing protein [Candidatus Hydrogenedentota bacterium]
MSHSSMTSLVLSAFLGAALCSSRASGAEAADLTAKWIWHPQESYHEYNDTIMARKEFTLPEFTNARLAITADTRYRLFINGTWVNDGPCRSWPDHYQYDVLDVAAHLKAGKNEILVVAKYFGVGTFHQIPQQAGLLVQLDVTPKSGDPVRVISDSTWETSKANGWVPNTPKRCVQMGPLEVYDARRQGEPLYKPAAVLFEAAGGPWKGLNERDCPPLTKKPFAFQSFREANVLDSKWMCVTFPTARLMYPGLIEANDKVSMASATATIVTVPKETVIHLESPGSTVTINGERGRDNAFTLHKGDNFLFMVVTSYFGHWQKDNELRFHETEGFELSNPINQSKEDPWCFVPFDEAKYVSADYAFKLLSPEESKAVTSKIEGCINTYLADVKDVKSFRAAFGDSIRVLSTANDLSDDPHMKFKARKVIGSAAQYVENPEALIKDDAAVTTVKPSPDGDIELVYDLGEENVGYYQFELTAEAGLEIDISAVEYVTPKGRVQHTGEYRNVMRYTCKEGLNSFTSLERRAGRFVFIRLHNQTKPASIRHFQLIESTYPVQPIGRFACSDPDLDKIWEISARTLKLCMEDTFTDCPLYEQTHWVGDARNEGLYGLIAFGSADLTERCVRLTGYSLEKYPIALCQTPSTWETLLPAWSHLWGISVWDSYFYTGDTKFLEEVWPQVLQNLRGTQKYTTNRGLFCAPFWNMFDWSGIDDNHSTVLHNSMLVVGAIDAALKCADVLGDTENAKWIAEYRASLVASINALWNAEKKCYPDSIHDDGTISAKSSVHTSFLALLYDIAPKENEAILLENVLNPPEGTTKVGAPFAIQYEYEALEKLGKQNEIIASIRKNYDPMIDIGATTVWESFAEGTTGGDGFPTRSHCHAWSSAPIQFLNQIVLGIVPTEVGGKAVTISPFPSGLTWAKGASATINGPAEVEWKLEGNKLNITAKVPQGVALTFKPNESLKGMEVVFNGAVVQ